MQFEQLDEHFSALDTSSMASGGADHFTAEDVQAKPLEVLGKVCTIYQKVRPFLTFASSFFLIPKKWKDVIKGYMELMDTLCPAS
jgi:hypothetical protein